MAVRWKGDALNKVWNTAQGYDSTLAAVNESLNKLDLEYIDLYLIHWPVKEKWKAMETLYKEGKVRAIGVCNFQIHHLEDLIAHAEIAPMVNQVECHPRLTQKELLSYCQEHHIQLEAWSPLDRRRMLEEPTLKELAAKYKKSVAQIILSWDLQCGIVTIPKSVKKQRIIENTDIFDFELSKEDMDGIDSMNRNHRNGPEPDNFNL